MIGESTRNGNNAGITLLIQRSIPSRHPAAEAALSNIKANIALIDKRAVALFLKIIEKSPP
jgi:hypothetical protein